MCSCSSLPPEDSRFKLRFRPSVRPDSPYLFIDLRRSESQVNDNNVALKTPYSMSIHTEHPLHRTHLTMPLDILMNSLSHLIYASSAESHMGVRDKTMRHS